MKADWVKKQLLSGKTVTTIDAINRGILRLAVPIDRFRKQGMDIETVDVVIKGKKQRYCGYKLKSV